MLDRPQKEKLSSDPLQILRNIDEYEDAFGDSSGHESVADDVDANFSSVNKLLKKETYSLQDTIPKKLDVRIELEKGITNKQVLEE